MARIQLRRDTAANWTAANPTLASGEKGIETDTGKEKTGDGTTAWNTLAYLTAAAGPHKASHEPGGSDALTVDASAATGSLRTLGTSATSATAGNDARLSDARTPTAHRVTHGLGGSDALTTADLATGTANATTFLRGDRTWAAPAGGASGGPTVGKFKSGRYYGAFAGAWTTSTIGLNVLCAVPFWVPEAVTFDRIGIRVGTAGSAGSTVRLGLYSDDGDGYPGALLVDSGTVDTTSTGLKELVINQAVTAGLVWVVSVAQGGSAPAVGATSGTAAVNLGSLNGQDPTAGTVNGYQQTGVSGALPANFVTTASGNYTNSAPFLRAA